MNRGTVEVFQGLMKKGWIDRGNDSLLWRYYQEIDVQEELEEFKAVIGFELVRAGDRVYLIPTQDNELFLKNNQDYRRDIKADSTIRNRDLYLMNYLAIYLIFVFFGGEGNDPLQRDFISKEDFISLFSDHCKQAKAIELESSEELDYSENFIQLADVWLSKLDGEIDSKKFDCKYGILNRILSKLEIDEIFEIGDDNRIRPTRKMKDLMPYFLRKDRISEIQDWIRGVEDNA